MAAEKALRVTADDLGLTPGVNRGIMSAYENGILTSASLMVNMPAVLDAVRLARQHPGLQVGLHINLTQGPSMSPDDVPSLADDNGLLRGRSAQAGWTSRDVFREVVAQAGAFLATGLYPTHVDSHHHVHRLPIVAEAAWEIARLLRVPLRFYDAQYRPHPGGLYIEGPFLGAEGEAALLRRLGDAPAAAGPVEFACHPGFVDERLKNLSYLVSERQGEHDLLVSPSLREALGGLGIRLERDEGPATPLDDADVRDVEAFHRGYNLGYDDGSDAAWSTGFQDGQSTALSATSRLPLGAAVPELVDLGAQTFCARHRETPTLASTDDVFAQAQAALARREGWSLAVLGDGEARFLAHDVVVRVETSMRYHAGVERSDPQGRTMIANAVAAANVVGVPVLRHFEWQADLFAALERLEVPIRRLTFTDSTIAYLLQDRGYLRRLLRADPAPVVLVVGNKAPALSEALRRQGVAVADPIAPVLGVAAVQDVLREVAQRRFDLALIAAGTASVALASAIAQRFGKVALDIGHLADLLASGIKTLIP